MMVIVVLFGLISILIVAILFFMIFQFIKTELFTGNCYKNSSQKKNIRNYTIRYNPNNDSYFIVNELPDKDIKLKHYIFFTKYYKFKSIALQVASKLNGNT